MAHNSWIFWEGAHGIFLLEDEEKCECVFFKLICLADLGDPVRAEWGVALLTNHFRG